MSQPNVAYRIRTLFDRFDAHTEAALVAMAFIHGVLSPDQWTNI